MSLLDKIAHNVKTEGYVSKPNTGSSSGGIMFSAPKGEENAIICKLVRDPRSSVDYVKLEYYTHKTGNNAKDVGMHPCRRSLKLGDSPELQAYNDANNKLKEHLAMLKKENPTSFEAARQKDPLVRQLEALKKTFSPRRGGYIFYVEPDSPSIKCLKLTQTGLEALFGREAWGDKPKKQGVVEYFRNKKIPVFLDASPELNRFGWIKIYKTGEQLGTEYHATPLEAAITRNDADGNPETVTKPVEKKVNQKIYELTDEDLASIPDPLANEIRNAWTEEESKLLVSLGGSIAGTPERFLRKDRESSGFQGFAQEADAVSSDEQSSPTPSFGNESEIPF